MVPLVTCRRPSTSSRKLLTCSSICGRNASSIETLSLATCSCTTSCGSRWATSASPPESAKTASERRRYGNRPHLYQSVDTD